MFKKLFCTIAAITFFGLGFTTSMATPLQPGTLLKITPGVGSSPNFPCATGTCFGMEVVTGFVVWTDFDPGTDGGIIVGKSQASGGQELGPSTEIVTPGELSAAWFFFGNFGTFFTLPDGDVKNVFDDTSCQKAACIGKVEIKVLNVAWNGGIYPMGSEAGCLHPNCSQDQMNGVFVVDYQINPVTEGAWSIDYSQVVPMGDFYGVKFRAILRGTLGTLVLDRPPTAGDVNISTISGMLVTWKPVVSSPLGRPLTCRIGDPALQGVTSVTADCSSGAYVPNAGFVGVDSFTYLANDGVLDSNPGLVTAAVAAAPPTTSCVTRYPESKFSHTGKAKSLTVTFSGNIVSHTNKEVKICPGTLLNYAASSTKGRVVCKIRGSNTQSSGMLKVSDDLMCTDKPAGKDVVRFFVKSGV